MLKSWKNKVEERAKLQEFCSSNAIKWTFSTPLASHHNGCVESMVKSVKSSLNKIVRNNILNEEEYRTVLAEVTACINSRALWPSSDDDVTEPFITCFDLLRPGGLCRDPDTMNVTCNPKKRYRHIQRIANEWWHLWMLHFVPNLLPRNKWYKDRKNMAVGDIVLLINKDISRGKWNMGLVLEVYPGTDGRVRSARVKISSGEYNQPITGMTLLLTKEEQANTAI